MVKKVKRFVLKRKFVSVDDLIQNAVHRLRVLLLTAVNPSISNIRGLVCVGRPKIFYHNLPSSISNARINIQICVA